MFAKKGHIYSESWQVKGRWIASLKGIRDPEWIEKMGRQSTTTCIDSRYPVEADFRVRDDNRYKKRSKREYHRKE
jgi:hypothetical protein